MIFDAEAYAEGIVEHAAGSTIEVLVMEIDYVLDILHNRIFAEDDEELESIESSIGRWTELRDEINRQNEEFMAEEEGDEDEEGDSDSDAGDDTD